MGVSGRRSVPPAQIEVAEPTFEVRRRPTRAWARRQGRLRPKYFGPSFPPRRSMPACRRGKKRTKAPKSGREAHAPRRVAPSDSGERSEIASNVAPKLSSSPGVGLWPKLGRFGPAFGATRGPSRVGPHILPEEGYSEFQVRGLASIAVVPDGHTVHRHLSDVLPPLLKIASGEDEYLRDVAIESAGRASACLRVWLCCFPTDAQ